MDACLCGTNLLIVFFSSSPQPPEYIKTPYLFYLYVNAPSHILLSLCCAESATVCFQFVYLQLLLLRRECRRLDNSVDAELITSFHDHSN